MGVSSVVVVQPPTGTVTFLFTDIEGSTRRWQDEPDAMRALLVQHDAILHDAIDKHHGHLFKHTGDGVAAAFASATDACAAAVEAQGRLGDVLPVRMGLHTGEAELRDGDYFGSTLNRCARLMSIAHGGQVLLSTACAALCAGHLPTDGVLSDLGEHRLRDLTLPEHVYQVLHPTLRSMFPPLRSLATFPGALPTVLTTFVGRDREVTSLVDALDRSRVVTLTGAGGVGKTRLALHVAAEMSPQFDDGAWFCELAPLTDRRAVPEAVAACLGVPVQSSESVASNLLAFLRMKHMLLVLDNCEHVIDAAASLVENIVHACSHVTILVTSREALGVDGELIRPVGSLMVPDDDASSVEVAATPSVRLFTDRAQSVRPQFVLDETNASAVAEICRRLDGVPLALELAAARVASLTVHEIDQRLDQRFRLLTGGRRTALERHQTLRAAVDWSYDLLSPDEATMFNRLAVFAGGWTLGDAEVVVSDDVIGRDVVLDLLSRLVSRSMVIAEEIDGRTRYRLNETMRHYARERLDGAGESDSVRRRHAEHYLALIQQADVGMRGPDEERWLRWIDSELANLQAALDWDVATGHAELALRFAIAFGRLGIARPRLRAFRLIENALAMPEARHHPLRPSALAAGSIGAVATSTGLAMMVDRLNRLDEAFEEAGIEPTPEVRFGHALLASFQGRVDVAKALGVESIRGSLESGDRHYAGLTSALLAMMLAAGGDAEGAVSHAQMALSIGTELGNPSLIGMSHTALGYAFSEVDPDRAIEHLETAITSATRLDNVVAPDVAPRALARLRVRQGDAKSAFELLAFCLDLAREFKVPMHIGMTCETLAIALASTGKTEAATRIANAVRELSKTNPSNAFPRVQTTVMALRAAMGDDAYERAAAQGSAMTVDDLLQYASSEVNRALAELNEA